MTSHGISLVSLFKLLDEVMRVKIEVDDKLDRCEAEGVGEDNAEACFQGCRQESLLVIFKPLQSPPVFTIAQNNQLDLSELGLDQTKIDAMR